MSDSQKSVEVVRSKFQALGPVMDDHLKRLWAGADAAARDDLATAERRGELNRLTARVCRPLSVCRGLRPWSRRSTRKKLDAPAGRASYSERIGTVETVFGNIQNQGMRRSTLRGRTKVNAQFGTGSARRGGDPLNFARKSAFLRPR